MLQDASAAGDLSDTGVAGSYAAGTGWESVKARFRWEGGEGDWPTKYAPWGLDESGPRGLTPPAALWVLSTDSFYYGTMYMLSQLTLNAQGAGEHANCWEWEFDAIEGLIGTVPRGHPLPGNINQLYVTATAQVSGCMPMPGTAAQGNGGAHRFTQPREFQDFCEKNPEAVGCKPWTAEGADIWHGGGYRSTDRFENSEDTPYVFAVAPASEKLEQLLVDSKAQFPLKLARSWTIKAFGYTGGALMTRAKLAGPEFLGPVQNESCQSGRNGFPSRTGCRQM